MGFCDEESSVLGDEAVAEKAGGLARPDGPRLLQSGVGLDPVKSEDLHFSVNETASPFAFNKCYSRECCTVGTEDVQSNIREQGGVSP